MRSKKRLTLIVMMIMAMFALIIGAVACGGSEKEAINMYILPQDQTLVDEDFSLPKYIGQDNAVEVEWKSSNTAAIEIVDGGEQYTAKVTLQDDVTEVTLTISAGGASKDFTVRVDGFSVYTFIDNYAFPQSKTSVSQDFTLDTSFTFQGKTANITWEVDAAYADLITLNEEKNGVIVTPAEGLKDVKIKATFDYNGDTATATYSFSVAPVLEHRQAVNKIYSVVGYPLELSGYIVHVSEASESYGNATFYMIDDDFCSGYYCYRVKIDKTQVAKYVEGAHVTVTGDTTKNYSGLWENNGGGTATVDDTTPINPREKVYAMDTDLLAGTPSLIWRESTFVSLSGWKVASKPDSKPTEAAKELFTLERDGVKIPVWVSKYMTRTSDELTALLNVYDSVEVGQFVNVTGILGSHTDDGEADLEGIQIQPVLASDITKVDAEGTNTDGAKVKKAVGQVAEKVAAEFSSLIAAEKTVEMPVSVDGVTISYRVAGKDLQNVTVTIAADGKITVAPVASEKNYEIEVTYKIGTYEGYSFFNIRNWKMSDAEIVAQVKAAIEKLAIDEVKAAGTIDIPEFDTFGATVTWAAKSGSPEWVTVKDGKVTIASLPAADTDVTLVATITLGSATGTAEVTFKVQKAPSEVFQALDAPAEGDYLYAAMHKGVRLYASQLELDGNYIATTEDVSAAVKLTIAKKSDTEWYIKMGAKYLEVDPYANSNSSGGVSYRLRLVDTATAVWEWDDEIKIFKQKPVSATEGVTAADAYFYIGMRDNADYTTMSPSDIKYITGTNAANLDVSQHPSRFGSMVSVSDVSDEVKAQNTLNELKNLSATTFKTAGEEVALPTANIYGATVEWTVKGGSDYVTITENTLKIAAILPATDTTVTLQIEVTVGEVVVKADVEITIKAAQVEGQGFTALTEAKEGTFKFMMTNNNAEKQGDYYATGEMSGYYFATTTDVSGAADFIIKKIGDNQYTITVGGKYLEFVPRTDGKTGVNIAKNDTQTEGKYWQWIDGIKNFVMESTYNKDNSAEATDTDLYYFGSFSTNTTMSGNFISRIATKGDDGTYTANGKEGVDQWVAHFGTYVGTVPPQGGDDEPTLPSGDLTLDFSSITATGTAIENGDATELFQGFTKSDALTKAEVSMAYQGNGNGGGEYENKGGLLKLGSSKNAGSLALTFSKKVTKVVILAKGWSATDTIAINGGETQTAAEKALLTFELDEAAETITIATDKRALIFGIVVTFASGSDAPQGPTDQEKANAAKEAFTLTPTTYGEMKEYTLPTEQDDAAITWAISGAAEYVALSANKLTVVDLPYDGNNVDATLTATFTVGEATATKQIAITISVYTGAGSAADPYTAAEANKAVQGFDANAMFKVNGKDKAVYAKGFVVAAGEVGQDGVTGVIISDVAGSMATTISITKIAFNTIFAINQTLAVGDEITVLGYLQMGPDGAQICASGTTNPVITARTPKTVTPADKLAAAKAAIENGTIFSTRTYDAVNTQGVELPTSDAAHAGVTFAWTMAASSGYAKIEGGKLIINAQPVGDDATATLTVTLNCEGASATATVTITIKATAAPNDGTQDKPYTIEEVIELGKDLTTNNDIYKVDGVEKEIYVKGYVTDIGKVFQSYGLSSVEIASEQGGSTKLFLYTVNWGEVMGTPKTIPTVSPLQVNDYIVIHGFLKYFNKLEIDKNSNSSVYPMLSTWQRDGEDVIYPDPDEEKIDAALATVQATMTIEATTVLSEGADEVSFAWSTDTVLPEGITFSGHTITVNTKPETDTQIVFTLTATCNDAHKDKTVTITVKGETAAPEPELKDGFNALTEAKEGTFKFAMSVSGGTLYYATGSMVNTYYYGTTTDVSAAADFIITKIGDNQYTITVGGKYLEFVPRTDGKTGVNIAMNDTRTDGKYWKWIDGIQNFVMESTYNKSGDAAATDLYYFGNFSTNTSMSGNYIGRIATGSGESYTPNNTEGVSQWVAHFGTYKAPAGGGTEPGGGGTTPGGGSETPAGGSIVYDFSSSSVTASQSVFTSTTDALAFFKGVNSAAELSSVEEGFTYIYPGNTDGGDFKGDGCLKLGGSGSKKGDVTLVFTKNVKQVVINCQAWNAKNISWVNVNADANGTSKAGQQPTASDPTDLTFTLTTASNTVRLNSTKYTFVFSITVYFE